MKKSGIIFLSVLFSLLAINFISSQEITHVISNSENWQDVYSTIHYANLKKIGSDFLVSTNHGQLLLNNIDKKNSIRVITSKSKPYVFNYPDVITSKSFAGADELSVDSANLELINDLVDIENFIVVGDSYGFNAMAVAPYAVTTRSWVFLANRQNSMEIENILSKRTIKKIIIYGYIDREVRDMLNKYNPEVIDNEDKFKDNIEIVKRYLAIKPTKQVALTNGEFIERELMNGIQPVLFTGRENVPDQIKDYLKNSGIEVGVLVGNELVGAATNIKRSTGVSVMVKFARGARAETKGISAIEGLDIFPLPTPNVQISIKSIKYNKATKQLEVTYKSDSNVPAFIKGTITLISGTDRIRVGDIDPIFIAPGDYKTISYIVNATVGDTLEADVYALLGEISSSLDKVLTARVNVTIVEVLDRCKLSKEDIKFLKYNKQKKYFKLRINNPYEIDCWIDFELKDVIMGYTKRTLGIEGSVLIKSKKSQDILIHEELNEEDLLKNPFIKLTVYSGEKEDNLVYVLTIDKMDLRIENLTLITYIIIILIILIIILIIIIFIIKRREDDED
ncbi:MAG: hypothetical protein WC867_07080 [Candidatus Pacearchaeota archaeon]|jgi:hypothetical protein